AWASPPPASSSSARGRNSRSARRKTTCAGSRTGEGTSSLRRSSPARFEQTFGSTAWIGRGDDGPAHHEIRGARGQRVRRAHRARLITFLILGVSNPRRHNRERGPARPPDERELLGRRDDAVQPAGLGQRGKPFDLVVDGTADT